MSTHRHRFSLTKRLSAAFLSSDEEKKDDDDVETDAGLDDTAPTFLSSPVGPRIASVLEKHGDAIRDDSFLKIVRQLEFWHADRKLPDDELSALAERLARAASWRELVDGEEGDAAFQIPKVRFGKTEVRMPIVTCGGMRVQETWIPDHIPLIKPNKAKVVKSKSQSNLKDVVLCCLKLGLNHFETARFYGSSEIQFVTALCELIEDGIIKRSDFIFQTKVPPIKKGFDKLWEATWANVDRLGYVDLFAFHCVSDAKMIDELLDTEDKDGPYQYVMNLKKEGKVKHVGFSTHGDAANVLRLVESNKFSYVNLHSHHFGDYHAAGTPDGHGGQGNSLAVKRALELDMGVFLISPFDKGGKLYRPTAAVAGAIGPEMSPIAFAALSAWKSRGMHTVSVGFARSSDLDEVIEAARMYAEDGDEAEKLVREAEGRLENLAVEKLGKEWYEKGLVNVPSFYDEVTDGVAIGHMLWLHNCLTAYGMYEYAKDRYGNLEGKNKNWSKSKSYEENAKKAL
ncbi:hypothetical protein ACHAWF_016919 [Thalassiosira exigua]